MRRSAILFAILLLSGCDRTTGQARSCAPMPSSESLSKTPSDELWKLVDNYRICPGEQNFPKEETVLSELIRRRDARATFELGSEYKSGTTHRQADGERLVQAAASMGYEPAKKEIAASER